MRRFFSLILIAVYTGAVFLAGMLVVQLYALYVLVYTGAVFMIGVYIGERLERSFAAGSADAPIKVPESAPAPEAATEFQVSNEMTMRKG